MEVGAVPGRFVSGKRNGGLVTSLKKYIYIIIAKEFIKMCFLKTV